VKACQALPVTEIVQALTAALDELEKFAPSQVRRLIEKNGAIMQYMHSSDIGDISISIVIRGEESKMINIVSDLN
jgi:hypothetical protein